MSLVARVAMERLEARVRELEEEVGRSRARSSQSSRTHQQALATVHRLEVHQDEEERCRERMVRRLGDSMVAVSVTGQNSMYLEGDWEKW